MQLLSKLDGSIETAARTLNKKIKGDLVFVESPRQYLGESPIYERVKRASGRTIVSAEITLNDIVFHVFEHDLFGLVVGAEKKDQKII